MKVTQNVVMDLLPAYLSGEASTDTNDLVEEFLRKHPEMSSLVDAGRREFAGQATLLAPAWEPAADHELRTLARTRSLMERQKWQVAVALMLTGLPFAFVYDGGRFTFLMLRDQPMLAVEAWIGAAILWVLYFLTRRKLRATGL